MKILGVGLSRTGTTSLAEALKILGFRTLHWAPERLRDVMMGHTTTHWRRYDDVDAVTDLPAALFWPELLAAYPGCRVILTIRDETRWLKSMRHLWENIVPKFRGVMLDEARRTQTFAYGSTRVAPLLYRKRYRDHNRLVQADVPGCLVMDIEAGDGWGKLCAYLGVPVPTRPFPHANRANQ